MINGECMTWLQKHQGTLKDDCRVVFPDQLSQVAALRNASVVSCLVDFSLIRVEGDDALTFLQGQLSSDVREVNGSHAQYSSYSTAKGRMLASFLIWHHQDAYWLMVSSDIADAIIRRLSMFVLRSKVKITRQADWSLIGLQGPVADQWVHGMHPDKALDRGMVLSVDGGVVVVLPGQGYVLAVEGNARLVEKVLEQPSLMPVGTDVWCLRDIDAGIAWVRLATQEQFVPQMANMEKIGAVSFKKGCYPGQEIVARAQYLGKMKRRLFKVSSTNSLVAGAKLFSPGVADQSIGMVVSGCAVGQNRYEGLAVVQAGCWDDGIYLDQNYSGTLEKMSLPYDTEVEENKDS